MKREGQTFVLQEATAFVSAIRSWTLETKKYQGSRLEKALYRLPEEYRAPYFEMLKTWIVLEYIRSAPRDIYHSKWKEQFLKKRKSERDHKNWLWNQEIWKTPFGWHDGYLVGLICLGTMTEDNREAFFSEVLSAVLNDYKEISCHVSTKLEHETLHRRFTRANTLFRKLGVAELVVYLSDSGSTKMCGRIGLEGGDPAYLKLNYKGWLLKVFPIPLDRRVLDSYKKTRHVFLDAGLKIRAEVNPRGPFANGYRLIGKYDESGQSQYGASAIKKSIHVDLLLSISSELLCFIEDAQIGSSVQSG